MIKHALLFLLSINLALETVASLQQDVAPRFRIIQSVSGSKGSEIQGRFIVDDPRNTFRLDVDKQVVVFFEWQGPPGLHRMEGVWKNPQGNAALLSILEQRAPQGRFGGYWTLLLGERVQPGAWKLEVRIDGEAAGSHAIEIQSGSSIAPDGTPAVPRLLAPGEVYERAQASTVTIEARDETDRVLSRGTGFVVGPEAVLTTFHGIDGASSLVVTLRDGRKVTTRDLLGWNRWQDWAVLKAANEAPAIPRAKDGSASVGDRCYVLDAAEDGATWVLVETGISGRSQRQQAGERLILSLPVTGPAAGGAVLNDRGEAVGIIGTNTVPGGLSATARPLSATLSLRTQTATPMSLVRLTREGATLAQLASLGEFLPPLTAARHVFQGSFGRKVDTKGTASSLVDQGSEFSKRDGTIILWLMWSPVGRLKTTYAIRFYDLDNKLLAESRPAKFDLEPGPYSYTYWPLDVARLPVGTFRVDALVGTEPAWRGVLIIKD